MSDQKILEKSERQRPFTALDASELQRCSAERLLALSLEEMRAIQDYFRAEGREPTEIELETIAQTWSEHCKHKTFRGLIEYTEHRGGKKAHRVYDDLLAQTIVRATKELNKFFCLSVFQDNAGIISFDKKQAVAFKVETHNHPSALEPYGGAGTGIGGVIRDILGAGLGAKPILNTDVFCVGHFHNGFETKSDAVRLTPEKILSGVIAGVRDYGNRMGIPTGNGAVFFHKGYGSNPLVFCGTVGLLPKNKIFKTVSPGDWIVSIGGRTGRDGIHGATFSSRSLEQNSPVSVVQIGNAIVEKKVADALLRARDKNLYRSITDCGAGGYSSAVGELSAQCGAKVYLEKVPLKYEGLSPWEIWVSESQERMVLAIPRGNFAEFEELCNIEEVECSVIGEFSDDCRLAVFYESQKICDLRIGFLHDGIPRSKKRAVWKQMEDIPVEKEIKMSGKDYGKILERLLAHPNIGSKKWIIQQYDHEVQGGSVIKPLVGDQYDGPSDATVVRPQLDSWKGIVVSNGFNPLFGEIDPYWMAANAIDESLRNMTAVGGDIEHCAILDNFCWGNIEDPEVLGGLVRCAQGAYEFAKGFGAPFISGKDSLNNTWRTADGQRHSIPGTLLISAISVIEDVRKCVTMDFKKQGNFIALLGETQAEMGGSHFNEVLGLSGGKVPKVDAGRSSKMMGSIYKAIQKGWIQSCHDLSEGGLSVALAEMCLAGNIGAELRLAAPLHHSEACLLFSESASRWIVEIEPSKLEQVKKAFASFPLSVLGRTEKKPALKICSSAGAAGGTSKKILELSVAQLKKVWRSFSDKQ